MQTTHVSDIIDDKIDFENAVQYSVQRQISKSIKGKIFEIYSSEPDLNKGSNFKIT